MYIKLLQVFRIKHVQQMFFLFCYDTGIWKHLAKRSFALFLFFVCSQICLPWLFSIVKIRGTENMPFVLSRLSID